jgi:hypothetical protein
MPAFGTVSGVFIRTIAPQITENEAIQRLQRSHPDLTAAAAPLSMMLSPSGVHGSRTCDPTAKPAMVEPLGLIDLRECQRCSWRRNHHFGAVLTLARWCFSYLDAFSQPSSLRTWREVFEHHAITSTALALALSVPDSALDDLGPLVAQARDIASRSVALSAPDLHVLDLHAGLAAICFSHTVTPDQAREFAQWCAQRAAFSHHGTGFSTALLAGLSTQQEYVFITPADPVTPEWLRSFHDPAEHAAIAQFYTGVVGTPVVARLRVAELPDRCVPAMRQLGCLIAPSNNHSFAALEVAGRLWDPNPASELHDLSTALKAAAAIAL